MRFVKTAILLGAFAAYAGMRVEANFEIWFDENGHAVASLNGGPLVPVVSGVEIEPISGLNALYYLLPENVGFGDVQVWEDPSHTELSDLLRFSISQPSKMYYFSDNSDPGDTDLADTGLPAVNPINVADVDEVGPEGDSHFDWSASSSAGVNIFHGISDGTLPDAGPGFGLSAVAMLVPLFLRRFRR